MDRGVYWATFIKAAPDSPCTSRVIRGFTLDSSTLTHLLNSGQFQLERFNLSTSLLLVPILPSNLQLCKTSARGSWILVLQISRSHCSSFGALCITCHKIPCWRIAGVYTDPSQGAAVPCSVDCWLTFASFRCLAQLRWSLDQCEQELDFVLSQTCLGAVTAVSRGVRRWEILFYMQTGTINCINWTFNFSQQYQGSALEQYIHLFESIKPAAHTTSKISTGRPDTAEVIKYSCSVHDHGSWLELFNFDTTLIYAIY